MLLNSNKRVVLILFIFEYWKDWVFFSLFNYHLFSDQDMLFFTNFKLSEIIQIFQSHIILILSLYSFLWSICIILFSVGKWFFPWSFICAYDIVIKLRLE